MKCKHCGRELFAPEPEKAQRDFETHTLQGCCPHHDWQTLTIAEQEMMMAAIQRKLALYK